MIAGHSAGRDDLAVVLALAADPRPRPSIRRKRLRRPLAARRQSARRARSGPSRSSAAARRPAKRVARTRGSIGRLGRAHGHACRPRSRRVGCRRRTTLPGCASSSCLRRIRRLLSSLSFFATAPRIRAMQLPVWVARSIAGHRRELVHDRPRRRGRRTPPAPAADGADGRGARRPPHRSRPSPDPSSIRWYSGRSLPLYALTSSSTYRSATRQPRRSASRSQSSSWRPTPSPSPSRSDEIRA